MSLFLRHNRGFGLIEIVITVAVVSVGFFALSAIAQSAFRAVHSKATERQAIYLAEETIEVARFLRDISWSTHIASLGTGVTYYPVFASTTRTWSFASTVPPFVFGVFAQEALLLPVYRDSLTHDITASTSPNTYLDAGTKEIISRVTWDNNTRFVEIRAYLSNMFQN